MSSAEIFVFPCLVLGPMALSSQPRRLHSVEITAVLSLVQLDSHLMIPTVLIFDSAVGYITGDQQKQMEGNVEAEKASWEHKQAQSSSPLAIPIPSLEGVTGKIQSAVGYLTGDQEMQKAGNLKSEKAAWRDGV